MQFSAENHPVAYAAPPVRPGPSSRLMFPSKALWPAYMLRHPVSFPRKTTCVGADWAVLRPDIPDRLAQVIIDTSPHATTLFCKPLSVPARCTTGTASPRPCGKTLARDRRGGAASGEV